MFLLVSVIRYLTHERECEPRNHSSLFSLRYFSCFPHKERPGFNERERKNVNHMADLQHKLKHKQAAPFVRKFQQVFLSRRIIVISSSPKPRFSELDWSFSEHFFFSFHFLNFLSLASVYFSVIQSAVDSRASKDEILRTCRVRLSVVKNEESWLIRKLKNINTITIGIYVRLLCVVKS